MKDYEDKQIRIKDECFHCGKRSIFLEGQCIYCHTQNDLPRPRLYFGKNRPFLKKPPVLKGLRMGEQHSNSKLNAEQVKEARQLYQAGGITYRKLAEKYNVSAQSLWGIINGRGWKHVS